MLIWQSGLKNEGKHTSKDDKVMENGKRSARSETTYLYFSNNLRFLFLYADFKIF